MTCPYVAAREIRKQRNWYFEKTSNWHRKMWEGGSVWSGSCISGDELQQQKHLCPLHANCPSRFCKDFPSLLMPLKDPKWQKVSFTVSYHGRQHIKKQRHYFVNKVPSSQGYGFSSSPVWMRQLGYKESWVLKNWCFWTMVLEKILESPLDYKEISPGCSLEGDQPWDFFGRNDTKAETPVLWPPHVKNWLTGKDTDAGRDWGQEEKRTTEDEMAGWRHQLDGHEFEWTLGVGDGQGGLACCNSWGCKKSDMTEQLNWTKLRLDSLILFSINMFKRKRSMKKDD